MLYNLVHGELIQAKDNQDQTVSNYISKSYYKTASLMSLACYGVGSIHGMSESDCITCHKFGSDFGIAFQIADDILDFTTSSEELGKPAGNDLKEGLVTAPVIFAQRELLHFDKEASE